MPALLTYNNTVSIDSRLIHITLLVHLVKVIIVDHRKGVTPTVLNHDTELSDTYHGGRVKFPNGGNVKPGGKVNPGGRVKFQGKYSGCASCSPGPAIPRPSRGNAFPSKCL